MTTNRQLLTMALEALEGWDNYDKWVWPESALEQAKRNTTEAMAALKAALAEPEQEPVAWSFEARHIDTAFGPAVSIRHPGREHKYMRNVKPLYTVPPQRTPTQSTHSADCYKWHHECAIARIEEFKKK